MKELASKVAVVTGAASGIGRALAERFAQEGMKVALADVEAGPLSQLERQLRDAGHDVLAVECDVSDRGAVEVLADTVYIRYGRVNVLCNNAGVSGGNGPIWTTTEQDWRWVMGVNVLGMVWGIQAFLPRMLAGGEVGHVVNTCSIGGIVTGGSSTYAVSKHAVFRLTEGMYCDLRTAGAPIGVTLLCPGMVATHIVSSERNRPRGPWGSDKEQPGREDGAREQIQKMWLDQGMPPTVVADMVIEAIRTGQFYLFTHPELMPWIEERFRDIGVGRSPDPEFHRSWVEFTSKRRGQPPTAKR